MIVTALKTMSSGLLKQRKRINGEWWEGEERDHSNHRNAGFTEQLGVGMAAGDKWESVTRSAVM